MTHIINVADRVFYLPTTSTNIVFKHPVRLNDYGKTRITRELLSGIFELIDQGRNQENNNVLVHCEVGVNRSALVVLAYLCCRSRERYDYTLDENWRWLKTLRDISINHSYLGQLRLLMPAWQRELKSQRESQFGNATENDENDPV